MGLVPLVVGTDVGVGGEGRDRDAVGERPHQVGGEAPVHHARAAVLPRDEAGKAW